MADDLGNAERRVIVVAPTTRDGEITRVLLGEAGLETLVCRNLSCACDELRAGAGALLMTADSLASSDTAKLISFLEDQPSWSDLPIILLLQTEHQSANAASLLPSLGNVTLLERPAPSRSVVSAVKTAVRGRQRQYQIRDHIAASVRAAEQAVRLQQQLAISLEAREQHLEAERLARAEAERVSQMKDEFLATLSHELRTPLNAIFGWAQILKMDHEDPQTIQECIDVIDRNVRLQTQLIEDLLDMSRIISGKIRLDVQRVDLPELIDNALESVRPAAEARLLRLERIVDPLAGPVSGDPSRLQQVLWNLLTNAIKFTPKGGKVQVVLERADSHVELSVVDTGEGIEAKFLPLLFERFSQADASTTRKHGGLGLGLSIVKTLVDLHGGTVRAASAGIGQGSRFVIQLPLRAVKAEDEESSPRISQSAPAFDCYDKLSGLNVLVVDDEPDARAMVKRFLVECGATTALAASAEEAHGLLNNFDADVIVSDIGMPKQDGYEFIQDRRNRGDKTPAVALTAFARAEDRLRSIQAGFQTHLVKPVEPAELIAVVASLAGRF
jgi:signal transduction histidine kinase